MNGPLWNSLSVYVRDATDGRDDSHGHSHMQEVAWLSMEISRRLGKPVNEKLIMAVAWLHDVSDHKYDPEGLLKEQSLEFLQDRQLDAGLVMEIIDRISYSREVRDSQSPTYRADWEAVLGPVGLLVRDIVSDADKLTAIGCSGYERCADFVREQEHAKWYKRDQERRAEHQLEVQRIRELNCKRRGDRSADPKLTVEPLYRSEPKTSEEEVYQKVHQHAEEKLLRLKDQFIRTQPGKEMAIPLHAELESCMRSLASPLPVERKEISVLSPKGKLTNKMLRELDASY